VAAGLAGALGASGPSVQLLPHVHGTDGFFISAFERQ
jgi:16S rRNA C967 or C1407 C5-methylase (RsmB/RsmF family)